MQGRPARRAQKVIPDSKGLKGRPVRPDQAVRWDLPDHLVRQASKANLGLRAMQARPDHRARRAYLALPRPSTARKV
jgi:hypothetical protein